MAVVETLEDELPLLQMPQKQNVTAGARIDGATVKSSSLKPTDCSVEDSEDSEDEESFNSYQTQPVAEVAIENIGIIIDRLYRLAFKIRSPATRLGFSKAEKYHDLDEETNVDLIDIFAEFDKRHVEETYCNYRKTRLTAVVDDFLVLRLAKANTRRRQQFGQWRRHKINSDKIKQQPPVLSKSDLGNTKRAQTGRFIDAAPLPDQFSPSRPSTATRIDQNKIFLDDDASAISTSTYAIFAQEAEADLPIPQLPSILKQRKEFECPFCHIPCHR